MTRPLVLVVEGLAVRAAFEEVGLETVLRPPDGQASTLLRSTPRLRECDLVTLASNAADGIETAESLALDIAKETRRTAWWAPEPSGHLLDIGSIRGTVVACEPPPPLTMRFADIETVPLRWLVPGFIPEGKLAVLAGQPGLGKSMLTVHIAARLSRGEGMPGEAAPERAADTLFLSSEDDPRDTIRPRLEAAGADLARIHFPSLAMLGGLDGLDKMLDERPAVRLVVVDPLGAYFGSTDSHKDAQVRGFLAPLAELCRLRGITLLLVAHLNKNDAASALHRVGGSIAIVAAARIAWAVGRDKEDKRRVLLVGLKNNVGREGEGWAFRVEPTEPSGIGRIVFEADRVTASAEDVLRSDLPANGKTGARVEAEEWLAGYLSAGPRPQREVESAAEAKGMSKWTLRRTREAIGVRPRKDGPGATWRWHLAAADVEGEQDAQGGTSKSVRTLHTLPPNRGETGRFADSGTVDSEGDFYGGAFDDPG